MKKAKNENEGMSKSLQERVKELYSENKKWYTAKFGKEKEAGDWFPMFKCAVTANAVFATLNDITERPEERKGQKHFEYSEEVYNRLCGKQEEQ